MSIQLDNVSKTYYLKGRTVEALKPTSLSVQTGEIYGLIGYSGAGKSTLLRLINLLGQPSSGTVTVGDDNLTEMSAKDLGIRRQYNGMIFQQFDLIASKTVYENTVIVLKASKYDKKDVHGRMNERVTLIGREDKSN